MSADSDKFKKYHPIYNTFTKDKRGEVLFFVVGFAVLGLHYYFRHPEKTPIREGDYGWDQFRLRNWLARKHEYPKEVSK